MFPQNANAAIATKVATAGAKKAVKEIIKDGAVDVAINFALDEAFRIAAEYESKYDVDQGYKAVCAVPVNLYGECDKPVQVKAEINDTDKTNIGNQADTELEKLITNGKGLTRWQKFLDWFFPIWLISFGATAITYALDEDVRSLFNEAGYNALVALGLIKPVTDVSAPIPIADVTTENTATEDIKTPDYDGYKWGYGTPITSHDQSISNVIISGLVSETKYVPDSNTPIIEYWGFNVSGKRFFDIGLGNLSIYTTSIPNLLEVTVAENGVIQKTFTNSDFVVLSGQKRIIDSMFNFAEKNLNSIKTRFPYIFDGFVYTDILYNTVDGNKTHVQIKSTNENISSITGSLNIHSDYLGAVPTTMYTTIYKNKPLYNKILPPIYEDIQTEFDIIKNSPFKNENNDIAMVPPSALPYTQISTGTQLEPKPNADGETIDFVTPDGTIVPEDDITIGDPIVSESPEGIPQVEPPATPSNPNPDPIPLTPPTDPIDPPIDPPTDPPIETEPPKFPEGESCAEGLKLPKLTKLLFTVSESFPFSIPFDLYDGFMGLFSEMGSEKPDFEYTFNQSGDKPTTIKFGIAEYFDTWKPFTDSVLIFIFDIGLIFLCFKMMGGAK